MGRARRGSEPLGRDLRKRRGQRSLREIERLTRMPPCAGRVRPLAPSSLHQIEQGARLPNVEQMRTLSVLYNVPIQHLYALIEGEAAGGEVVEGEDFLALRERAATYRRLDQPASYLACLLRCEEAAGSPARWAWVRRARARALREMGQAEEAGVLLLELLSREGVPEEELGGIWLETAESFLDHGNLEVAEAAARMGTQRVHPSDDLTRARLDAALGRVLRRIAERADEPRTAREASRLLQRAMEEFSALGVGGQEAGLLETELALSRLAEGNRLLAHETLRRALSSCRRAGETASLAFAHKAMGKALLETGRAAEAREHLVRGEGLAATRGLSDLQFQCLVLLCEVDGRLGRRSGGTWRRAQKLLPSLRSRSPERRRFEALIEARTA